MNAVATEEDTMGAETQLTESADPKGGNSPILHVVLEETENYTEESNIVDIQEIHDFSFTNEDYDIMEPSEINDEVDEIMYDDDLINQIPPPLRKSRHDIDI